MLPMSAALLLAAFAVACLAAAWLAARLLWLSGPGGAGKGSGD
jgi:hypothetical protein